ncbi:uncharacterized protein LOC121041914 isoform X2 [Herpailurus yagouaroundi]|uniref:uncharacterized protein LOC121041914 isoform X2 n=1 Tax=Herpailurus yagouaroundi TaxID=1608482 RepID=UPI001AD77534|nr:uncharacterized protein LOC121041914 isoform X2 [Puma yagouaroundi]
MGHRAEKVHILEAYTIAGERDKKQTSRCDKDFDFGLKRTSRFLQMTALPSAQGLLYPERGLRAARRRARDAGLDLAGWRGRQSAGTGHGKRDSTAQARRFEKPVDAAASPGDRGSEARVVCVSGLRSDVMKSIPFHFPMRKLRAYFTTVQEVQRKGQSSVHSEFKKTRHQCKLEEQLCSEMGLCLFIQWIVDQKIRGWHSTNM